MMNRLQTDKEYMMKDIWGDRLIYLITPWSDTLVTNKIHSTSLMFHHSTVLDYSDRIILNLTTHLTKKP